MSIDSFVRRSLLALSVATPLLVVLAGCAAQTEPAADPEELAAETDDLTAAGNQLVGSYYADAPASGGFARLELKKSGKYTAKVDGGAAVVCISAPCLVPESGTWNASKTPSGGFRLRVTAAGKAARYYETTKVAGAATTLRLVRAGVTETLVRLDANQCVDDSDCKAADSCQKSMCAMYCLATDPGCCPDTCQPKAATTPCGTASCGAGTVCCNPLAGICVLPGQMCAF